MTAPDRICPLGEDCDLHIAWMAGAEDQRERMQAKIDALQAENERLRHQISEASDPDFIWGALDNVYDAETTLDDYAAAASRAIRAALGGDKP